jgi:elongator complex protein 2
MTMNINGMKVRHGIIAVGVESGLIEIWAVPLIEGDWSAAILHSIPVQDCHLGVVKKLAWRPAKENESVLTLASCGSDNGVRLFSISLISWTGTS